MSKRIFVLLVLLMSMSLIGIIFVQAYYIKDSVKNEKERFEFNVKKTLSYVSNAIEKKELDGYYKKYQNLDNEKKIDSAAVSKLFIYQQDNNTKEMLVYKSGMLEENYKLTSSLFDIGLDSVSIKNIIGSSNLQIFKNEDFSDKDLNQNISPSFSNSSLFEAQINSFDKNFKAYAKTIPVYKRVSEEQISELLSKKLKEDNIDIDYEFAIYGNDLATKVHSDGFEKNLESTYSVPIFYDENNQSNYKLLVSFPDDNKFIL